MEVVRYVSPAPEEHGHWVQPEGEVPRLTRCYVQKAERVPNEATWIALEKETVDELSKRRRIREKSSIRLLKSEEMSSSQDPEELKAEASRREVKEMMEESVGHMFEAEAEVAAHEVEVLRRLKKMTEEAEEPEDEVLQTKVISPKEVSKAWNHWLPAVEEEVNSLIVEKEALQQIGKKEVEEIVRKAEKAGKKVEFLPSKMVCTRKPGPLGGRMKVRWVVCGNFEEKRSNEDTYSSGADASAFRLLAATAAHFQWQGGTVDIKTAFLNAEMEAAEGESIIIIKPPMVMLEKNFLAPNTYFFLARARCLSAGLRYLRLTRLPRHDRGPVPGGNRSAASCLCTVLRRALYHYATRSPLAPNTFYIPLKAVYGFRRSPRLWGNCRDRALSHMEIKGGEKGALRLHQVESEPNLWKILQEGSEEEEERRLKGLLMTYVDDICVVGDQETVNNTMEKIREKWKTSVPDSIGEVPIRFLGMEVAKLKDPDREGGLVCLPGVLHQRSDFKGRRRSQKEEGSNHKRSKCSAGRKGRKGGGQWKGQGRLERNDQRQRKDKRKEQRQGKR